MTNPKSASKSPNTTKPKGDDRTTLAQVPAPEKLTEGDIKDISADDGSERPSNTANSDVADALRQDKAEAKGKEPERPYHHGHGGAADI